MFGALDTIITALQSPVSATPLGLSNLGNRLSAAATAFHNSLSNVTMVQTSADGCEQELQAPQTTTSSTTRQAQNHPANVTAIDLVSTISQFEQLQNALQAAQKSSVQVQGLSLFQYVNP